MKRVYLSMALLAVAGALAAFAVRNWPAADHGKSPSGVESSSPAPSRRQTTSSSPFENTQAAAAYVGIEACAECHADEHRTYRETAHRLALADVDAAAEPPDAGFYHALSGRTYAVYRNGDELRHREALTDEEGETYAAADFPLRYLVGSGRHTRSYLVEVDGFLSESPLTWYASKRSWRPSPGYDVPNPLGFERAVETTCLFCHIGTIAAPDRDYQRLTVLEKPIGCERCHGPGSPHVAEQRAVRDGLPRTGASGRPTIVNPGRLSRSLAEAICAQCHLHSDATAIVRGRSMYDYRPGLPLSDFCVTYRPDEPDSRMTVVGHVDQLRLSRCYQASETLTCTTCHDPHQATPPNEKRDHYAQVCASCHAGEGCRLAREERLRRSPANDCVACHMPQVDTDVPHVAFSHHKIGVHSDSSVGDTPASQPGRIVELVPCDDVSHLSEIERDRNLGLAYFGLSQKQTAPAAAAAYRDRARPLLDGVRSRGWREGEVAAALLRLYRPRDPEASVKLAFEALESEGLSPKSRINCLFCIAEVGLRSDRIDMARPALEKLIALRRNAEDWRLLAICKQRGGDFAEALHDLERAASIAPFRPDIRESLGEMHESLGDHTAAERERSIARRLQSRKPAKQ